MRRVTLIGLTGFALAPAPAAADTVAHRTPAVGPAIAGAQTVWGEERHEGVRVMIGRRGAQPRALYRLPDSSSRKTQRNFLHTPWALSASPTHVAAIVHTGTITSEGSDFVGTTVTSAAVGGRFAAPAILSGSTPRRGDAPCRSDSTSPTAVAVDGARIAVVEEYGSCEAGERVARVAVHDGDAVQSVPVPPYVVTQLRLAGRYAAWVEENRDHELVVHDLATGTEVLRERRFSIGDFDLDAEGRVVITFANGPKARRLGLLRAGTPGLRTLDRRVAYRGVALAGGRVLYERIDRGDFHSRLLLRELAGGVRRLATFIPRRRRVGEIDLSPNRAVWAAQKTRSADYEAKPSGPARIVSRPL